jgi:hypothetical protein
MLLFAGEKTLGFGDDFPDPLGAPPSDSNYDAILTDVKQ